MKTAAQPVEVRRADPDLIDRIANALPAEIRADYYREMRHCRSLPENDEMLRILRAMQFLVLLIQEAPGRVGVERGLIEVLLNQIKDHLRETLDASQEYHAQLESRLIALPDAIAKGISPEAIAATIRENLRQHFVRSTLPETVDALGITANQMKEVCGKFAATARDLGETYHGAAQDARRAVSSIRAEITAATNAAEHAAKELEWTFDKAYRWSAFSLSGLGVILGFVLGGFFGYWIAPSPTPVAQAPAPDGYRACATEIHAAIGNGETFASAQQLIDTASTYGLRGRGLAVSCGSIPQLRLPAILHWHHTHFVVLTAISDTELTIIDPALGLLKLTLEQCAQLYSGTALEFWREENVNATVDPERAVVNVDGAKC